MVGIRTPDRTYVWMDARGRIQTAGPRARHWKRLARGRHPLPDYDAKIRAEQAAERRGEWIIAEPGDILRKPRSFGELVDVMRGLAPGCDEWVQVPAIHAG